MSFAEKIKPKECAHSREWKLDPYSNPFSHSTMIFAYHCEGRLFPVGTISFVGKTGFMISASHVFDEGLMKSKLNLSMDELIGSGVNSGNLSITTKGDLGFSAIRFNTINGEVKSVTIFALEHISACIPEDIFYASAYIVDGLFPVEHLTLRPEMPKTGEKVYSCGYTNFLYDFENGFSLEEIKEGVFNWKENFSFDFMVYEGCVKEIYVNEFVSSYLNAPCFVVDYLIPPGLSGGPTFDSKGIVCGINSASLGSESLISLIYPTIFLNIKFSINTNQLKLSSNFPLINHIKSGKISTDGSEEKILLSIEEDKLSVYHQWIDYSENLVYESRSDQEMGLVASKKELAIETPTLRSDS